MRKAVIDLGTNTFNLLVGEMEQGKLSKILLSERFPVMLGMGGINQGVIARDAYLRAIDALTYFKKKAEEFQVYSIKGYGTSAMRDSVNGMELIAEVRDQLGFEIELISGNREAELIFQGVQMTYDFSEPALIMDIGGGSTEFIRADRNGMDRVLSLNIGVSRIYQLLGQPVDFTEADRNRVIELLEKENQGQLEHMSCETLIGASGTFETFYEMIHQRRYVSEGIAVHFNLEDVKHAIDWSIYASFEARSNNHWVIDIRKKMLPVGAIKVKWLMEKLKINEVYLSPYSLKEGAFLE